MSKDKYRGHVFLIYRKLKGTYHESPWVLYRRAWFYTRGGALDVAYRINEWDRAFIGSESTVQVRKFYYDEPTKKDLRKYRISSKSYTTGRSKVQLGRTDKS